MLKVVLATLLMVLSTQWAIAANSPKALHAQASKAIAVEAASQKQYTQWSDKKEGISAELRDMKAMDSWLEFQNKKYTKYIAKQKETIAELKRRKEEAKKIRMELEPFLETVVGSLEDFVKADLPFLKEERSKRIEFLHASLDDYHLELSEKLRRVFEALLIETEYGRNVATTTQELDINGTPAQVSVFRLGRTALFYQTADGEEAGVWDKTANAWVPLDDTYSRTVHRAKDMAAKKRAIELLSLPIGAAQ